MYAKDEHRKHYNVEMQVRKKAALGKRSRYYQSQMDMEILLSGEDYAEIPDTYVIFLCDFDPFGEEKYRYTFAMKCQESEETNLEDGRVILFLNTHGKNESEVPKELVTFLKYVKADLAGSEEKFDDPYVEQLQKFIRRVKESREMEERFMIFEEMLKEERAEGRLEGYVNILLNVLQEIGEIPPALQEKIASEKEEKVLIAWAKLAAKVTSKEEFLQNM